MPIIAHPSMFLRWLSCGAPPSGVFTRRPGRLLHRRFAVSFSGCSRREKSFTLKFSEFANASRPFTRRGVVVGPFDSSCSISIGAEPPDFLLSLSHSHRHTFPLSAVVSTPIGRQHHSCRCIDSCLAFRCFRSSASSNHISLGIFSLRSLLLRCLEHRPRDAGKGAGPRPSPDRARVR